GFSPQSEVPLHSDHQDRHSPCKSSARERAPSSSITPRSSSLLFSGRSDHQSRLHTKLQSPTFSCKTNLLHDSLLILVNQIRLVFLFPSL
ncbi:unnamed protein product, partial [Brassica oleracea]